LEIAIVFGSGSQIDARGSVWIVDSPDNRNWFAQQEGLDGGSAVFTPEGGEIGQAAILRSIWNVQEHYPQWSQINVSGVLLTPDLTAALQDEGAVAAIDQGFSLTR
jgi:hypothetical protein